MAGNGFVRVGLIIAGTVWFGCGVDPVQHRTGSVKSRLNRGSVLLDVPLPPGLLAAAVERRKDDEWLQAQLGLAQVLAKLPRSRFLPVPADSPDTQPTPGGGSEQDPHAVPPLAAQHAYLAGRQAWRKRQNFEAIKHLHAALQVAPESAAVLRLLGKVYSQSGNLIRGSMYLEKAVAADPLDAESLFLLGRLLSEQGRWTDAIATFAYAGGLPAAEADPALGLLNQYYLGHALDHEGFDSAAIGELETCLARSVETDRTTRWARHTMVLDRQRWATYQTLGDAYNRLDQPVDAMAAYRRAAALQEEVPDGLVRRLVYTALRLGRKDIAAEVVRQFMQVTDGEEVALSLVHYLSQHGVESVQLASLLRDIYDAGNRTPSLAITIADLLDARNANAFLSDHVRSAPGDRSVFEHLVKLELSRQPVDLHRVSVVLKTTADLIDLLPSAVKQYTKILVDAVGHQQVLIDAIFAMDPARRAASAVRFIYSQALVGVGRFDEAVTELEQVAAGDRHGVAARIELARLLVDRGDLDRADELLDMLPNPHELEAVRLRLAVLVQRGTPGEAIRFLDKLLGQHPAQRLDFVIEKAKLQTLLGDALQAQATLQAALEAHPRSGRLYEQLIDLYRFNRVPDAQQHYQELVKQMLTMIPHERVARVERARLLVAGGHYGQAEPLLRTLLREDTRDIKPLGPLLTLLVRTDRGAEAEAMLDDRLKGDRVDDRMLAVALRHYLGVGDRSRVGVIAQRLLIKRFADKPKHFVEIDFLMEMLFENGHGDLAQSLIEARLSEEPTNRTLLMAAGRHYTRSGNKQRVFETTEQLLLLGVSDAKRSMALSMLYIKHDQPEKAIPILEEAMAIGGKDTRLFVNLLARALAKMDRLDEADQQFARAIERFPNQAVDIKFDWAMHQDRCGNWQRTEAILLDVLETRPTHVLANNALGYAWADRGMNLDRATEMIRKAIDVDGDNAAFLDSMGWVLYKRGQFKDAVVWLQRASDAPGGDYPVILNHLGDALYRVGRSKPAVALWQRVQQGVGQHDASEDRELRGLEELSGRKIDAVKASQVPEVADAPGLPVPQPAQQGLDRDAAAEPAAVP